MSVEVVLDSPLAHALNEAIPPKLVEVGWSTPGGDDSALSEYIILMLVNGKTQQQIAAELAGDLLNLGPDDPGAMDFSQWLFRQVEEFNAQTNGGFQGADAGSSQPENGAQDADMGDVSDAGDGNVPTGPKSMRNGGNRTRDKRMLGHLAKAMDRSNESVLHRVRPQNGNERINSHARAPPTGPRQQAPVRGGPRALNSRMPNNMGGPMNMQQGPAASIMNMSQKQQHDLYAMLEQQSRLMAQMLGPQQHMQMGRGAHMPMGNGMGNGFQPQQNGRSLFDRVQPNPQRPPNNNGFRKGPQNNKFGGQQERDGAPSSSMDVEMSEEKEADPENTTCNWNLTCTNKDCKFAHQSPAAPPGTAIDYNDVCSFGAACKNRKCVARHPSPAQKIAHQTATECRYGALCTNAQCPFVHPTMPLCRNGADCTTPNCKFTHTKTECKFNPCLKPNCPFKHAEGQKRGKFDDKVWVADGIKKEHVSERKFVDEEKPEELVLPGGGEGVLGQASTAPTELIA